MAVETWDEMTVQRWEYQRLFFEVKKEYRDGMEFWKAPEIDEKINHLGKEGWELIHWEPPAQVGPVFGLGPMLIFKRLIQQIE